MGSFCKKTYFFPPLSPPKFHKRPPARLSLAPIPGATKFFREFRIYRRNRNDVSEPQEPAPANPPAPASDKPPGLSSLSGKG